MHTFLYLCTYIIYIYIHTCIHFYATFLVVHIWLLGKKPLKIPKRTSFLFSFFSVILFYSSLLLPPFFFFLFFFFFSKRGNNCIIFFLSLKNIRKQEDSGLGFICPFFVCLFVLVLNGHGILMAEKYTSECFCKAQFCLFFFF